MRVRDDTSLLRFLKRAAFVCAMPHFAWPEERKHSCAAQSQRENANVNASGAARPVARSFLCRVCEENRKPGSSDRHNEGRAGKLFKGSKRLELTVVLYGSLKLLWKNTPALCVPSGVLLRVFRCAQAQSHTCHWVHTVLYGVILVIYYRRV